MLFPSSVLCNDAGQGVLRQKVRSAINQLNRDWNFCSYAVDGTYSLNRTQSTVVVINSFYHLMPLLIQYVVLQLCLFLNIFCYEEQLSSTQDSKLRMFPNQDLFLANTIVSICLFV